MKTFLIGAAALATVGPALAQPVPPAPPASMVIPVPPRAPMPPMRERTQTRDQMVAKVRDHFAKLDTNRDGFIGDDEMTANRKHPGGAWQGENSRAMALHDSPMRDPNAMFDRLDANHDGAISRDEFAKGREMRIEHKVVINGAPGAPGGEMGGDDRMMKMRGMRGGMGGHMMKMADLNKDGRVSLQEATTSALQHFDMVDTNRDGRITPEERQAMHQKMMQEHGRKVG